MEVIPYDPEWQARFERLRDELPAALRDVAVEAIEHVGSTAVPGLAAKPVIDVDVVVFLDSHVESLTSLSGGVGGDGA